MSAGSGIAPNSETLALVEELRKKTSKFRFSTFKIQGTNVVPDKVYPETDLEVKEVSTFASSDQLLAENFEKKVWPVFLATIEKADGPRFGIVDFAFINKEGSIKKILACVSFCSDKCPARVKMTFSSTRTAFENKVNIGKKYGANDISELEYATVKEALSERI